MKCPCGGSIRHGSKERKEGREEEERVKELGSGEKTEEGKKECCSLLFFDALLQQHHQKVPPRRTAIDRVSTALLLVLASLLRPGYFSSMFFTTLLLLLLLIRFHSHLSFFSCRDRLLSLHRQLQAKPGQSSEAARLSVYPFEGGRRKSKGLSLLSSLCSIAAAITRLSSHASVPSSLLLFFSSYFFFPPSFLLL